MFKRLKVIGGGVLAFSVLLILAAQYVKAQAARAQTQRQVQFHIATRIEPVVVTKITLGNVAVQPGRFIKTVGTPTDPVTPFWADDDWVQNLTVYLLNRTNQTIVYSSVYFSFPETSDLLTHSRAVFPLTLGRIPPSVTVDMNGKAVRQRPESQPILFRPGQTMAIHLGDYIDQIKTDVESVKPLAALTTVEVGFGRFFFADGMQWNGGYRVLDPQSSNWRRMGPDYFPGDMDGRWPGRTGWIDQQ
jgi:hypothetical protein